jgi:hypothetical protein
MTDNQERTCDSCGEKGRCIPVGEAVMCERCIAHHERALEAAQEAITHIHINDWAITTRREVVAVAVKAYLECEFDDADHRHQVPT